MRWRTPPQEQEQREREAQGDKQQAEPYNATAQLKTLLGVGMGGAPGPSPAPQAWTKAAAARAPKLSLLEIQQEEERRRAQQAAQQPQSTGGEWAALAAQGAAQQQQRPAVRGWAGPPRTTPAQAPPHAPPSQRTPTPEDPFWGRPAERKPSAPPPPPPPPQAPAPVPAPAPVARQREEKPADDFGGSRLPPEMAAWCVPSRWPGLALDPCADGWMALFCRCREQLRQLNGNDDLTLISFCMSLESSVEIRQYLSQYLGSKPAVVNFASEFIKKKTECDKRRPPVQQQTGNGGGATPGAANGAGKKKKKGKGQKVDQAMVGFSVQSHRPNQGEIVYDDEAS
jgi:hypothetical protein